MCRERQGILDDRQVESTKYLVLSTKTGIEEGRSFSNCRFQVRRRSLNADTDSKLESPLPKYKDAV